MMIRVHGAVDCFSCRRECARSWSVLYRLERWNKGVPIQSAKRVLELLSNS